MDEPARLVDARALLERAGLPAETATAWLAGGPPLRGEFAAHAAEFSKFWQRAAALLATLPKAPGRNAGECLPEFIARGAIDLGAATVQRVGKACLVQMRHPRFLNAEDDTTIEAIETAVGLAILDPGTEVAVLRGDTVEHAKYRGRRVFSAGINLTHLYLGKIPYVWYLKRDMGVVNKIFRGLARQDASPEETVGQTVEKPWIAAVDAFAIGRGCP